MKLIEDYSMQGSEYLEFGFGVLSLLWAASAALFLLVVFGGYRAFCQFDEGSLSPVEFFIWSCFSAFIMASLAVVWFATFILSVLWVFFG